MAIEIAYKNEHCEWLDCENASLEDINFLKDRYNIDPLLLEDTTDANHLPKFEEDEGVLFFLTRENTDLERKSLNNISDVSTKLGIFIVGNTIITVHRLKNRSIYEYRAEIEGERTEVTTSSIALHLFLKVLKSFDDESIRLIDIIEKMENDIFLHDNNHSSQIRKLFRVKRKAGLNFRILNISGDWVRNVNKLQLTDAQIADIEDKHKDVVADFDHLIAQVSNLISMFLALSDQKANQVMKLLAIYSVYFLPLTFIAGVYGMNFDNMPELHTPFGYFVTLGVMFLIVFCTFIYFKKKRWH